MQKWIDDKMKTLEWIDNADSWLCPVCRTEVWSPVVYNYHCPECGFIAEKDKRIDNYEYSKIH